MRGATVRFRKYLAESLWRKRILFGFLGALGGYGYYYFVGCRTGTCPISSNPWISTVYGIAMGLVLTMGQRKERKP